MSDEDQIPWWKQCLCRCGLKEERLRKASGYLYAFDFDHTIVDQNSDMAVMEIIHNPVPQNLQRLFDGSNWEEYMEGVFKFVRDEGGSCEIIADKIAQLQPTEGMPSLLHRIVEARLLNPSSKLILVSDANTFFIHTYLASLKPVIKADCVITNFAEQTEEGYLKLSPYEYQTACGMCPRNLCKGQALENYVAREGPFRKIFYVGDGGNDICPGVRLSENDVLFVRRNYAMDKILRHGIWKGYPIAIKAKVVFWDTAEEIEQEMLF